MESISEMQARILQLEAELAKKNHELEAVRAEYGACFTSIESKLAAVCQNEPASGSSSFGMAGPKVLVNKPELFKGAIEESLDLWAIWICN